MKHFLENLSLIEPLWELVGFLFAGVGGFLGIWWKVSRGVANTKTQIEALEKGRSASDSLITEMTKALVQLATKLDEREKDIAKLEGAMEVQRRDLVHVITGLQQTSSSLDGMWRTLQTLFPDHVPRRASDKKG